MVIRAAYTYSFGKIQHTFKEHYDAWLGDSVDYYISNLGDVEMRLKRRVSNLTMYE